MVDESVLDCREGPDRVFSGINAAKPPRQMNNIELMVIT